MLTAVSNCLSPVLVSTKDRESERLTVHINAYGPQEGGDNYFNDQIIKFWEDLEEEIMMAYAADCAIVVQLDANAKIGRRHIKNDCHDTSKNGVLLLEMAERQSLSIANTFDMCEGTMTRQRNVDNSHVKHN